MEMTLNQKIEWVRDLLSGQYSLWNRDVLYICASDIPDDIVEFFWDIILKFKREGLIKKASLGFAGLFDAAHKPGVFKNICADAQIPSISFEDGNGKPQTSKLRPTYRIKIISGMLNQKNNSAIGLIKSDVEFDALNGSIFYGKVRHNFRRSDKNPLRLRLIKELWDKRKIIKNGKIRPEGMPLPPETVANRIGLIDSPQKFNNDAKAKNKLASLIKYLNRNLRDKNLPITINKKGGIQIVIETK